MPRHSQKYLNWGKKETHARIIKKEKEQMKKSRAHTAHDTQRLGVVDGTNESVVPIFFPSSLPFSDILLRLFVFFLVLLFVTPFCSRSVRLLFTPLSL